MTKLNKQTKFGLDIDGTVTCPTTFIPYLNKHFHKSITLADITEYELSPLLDVTKEEFGRWMTKNEPVIYKNAILANHFMDAIQQWQDKHHFTYISARGRHLLSITEDWLEKHGIPFHHIELLGQHNKLNAIKEHKIEIFFEDKHDNACDIAEECMIPVILFDTPYNQEAVPNNVIRVKDWKEAAHWVNSWL